MSKKTPPIDSPVFTIKLQKGLAERQRQMLDTTEEEQALASLDRALEEAARHKPTSSW